MIFITSQKMISSLHVHLDVPGRNLGAQSLKSNLNFESTSLLKCRYFYFPFGVLPPYKFSLWGLINRKAGTALPLNESLPHLGHRSPSNIYPLVSSFEQFTPFMISIKLNLRNLLDHKSYNYKQEYLDESAISTLLLHLTS